MCGQDFTLEYLDTLGLKLEAIGQVHTAGECSTPDVPGVITKRNQRRDLSVRRLRREYRVGGVFCQRD